MIIIRMIILILILNTNNIVGAGGCVKIQKLPNQHAGTLCFFPFIPKVPNHTTENTVL